MKLNNLKSRIFGEKLDWIAFLVLTGWMVFLLLVNLTLIINFFNQILISIMYFKFFSIGILLMNFILLYFLYFNKIISDKNERNIFIFGFFMLLIPIEIILLIFSYYPINNFTNIQDISIHELNNYDTITIKSIKENPNGILIPSVFKDGEPSIYSNDSLMTNLIKKEFNKNSQIDQFIKQKNEDYIKNKG